MNKHSDWVFLRYNYTYFQWLFLTCEYQRLPSRHRSLLAPSTVTMILEILQAMSEPRAYGSLLGSPLEAQAPDRSLSALCGVQIHTQQYTQAYTGQLRLSLRCLSGNYGAENANTFMFPNTV